MLSAFDGVGAAPWLVWDLIGEPRAIFSWEVDRAAIQVADYHIPGIRHRGDITEDTPEDLAAEIQHIDGQAECIIIFTAAPPCQDFSRVGDRDGHAGTEAIYLSTSRRSSSTSCVAGWRHAGSGSWWRMSR